MTDRVDGRGKRIGVLTSGGDAQGMNAAVRAVVRTAISAGAEVFAIHEGYQGMVDGGSGIEQFYWNDVSSILHRGGTVIGTFRSLEFRERHGRRTAAKNLVKTGIDRVVAIGGDGSLTGLNQLALEWPELMTELVACGELTADEAAQFPKLRFVGLVGSIDNDLVGTDITIGADSALHRITDAVDALTSTAASHQRSFVIEVMGRNCGYLALVSAIAGGCDYVLIPENPPAAGWEDDMCQALKAGRAAGRRDSLVIIAEGAKDQQGQPITAEYVRSVIVDRTGEDARVTNLGHVQRGGQPSAFDRWCSTLLGYEAAREALADHPNDGIVLGIRGNRVAKIPLLQAVSDTREVPKLIEKGDYSGAMAARGSAFTTAYDLYRELSTVPPIATGKRIAVMNAGGLAPGMNPAVRAAVRLGISRGFKMLACQGGFPGLMAGDLREMDWREVEGWVADGGSHIGTRRVRPKTQELYSISRQLEEHQIDGLLLIGGWSAYEAACLMNAERDRYPAFNIPIVCVPASIDNNLPGSETAIGTDTALNTIVETIDKVKESAAASTRCFVVETMGRYCGYLALLGGLAAGSERIYLHEEGLTLSKLNDDVAWLKRAFQSDRKLVLAVRNELANEHYTTDWLARMFEEEGKGLFDVRQTIIGHQQQGGSPSPFDRMLATRLVSEALHVIAEELESDRSGGHYVGMMSAQVAVGELETMMKSMDREFNRPKDPWWLSLQEVVTAVSVQKY